MTISRGFCGNAAPPGLGEIFWGGGSINMPGLAALFLWLNLASAKYLCIEIKCYREVNFLGVRARFLFPFTPRVFFRRLLSTASVPLWDS
jgi:hypothetical protein